MDNENPDNFNTIETEDSFEDLLNQTSIKQVRVYPGEKVEAVIVKITDEWVFIDFGGKSEGFINTAELGDDEGNLGVKEGDSIQAYLLSYKNNEMLFTTRLAGNTIEKENLRDAYQNGIPIEGSVEKEIKGGYEVKITGNIRAFCPFSQMGSQRTEETQKYIGQTLTFKIIEYEEKGRNIIVSNRAIMEEERKKQKDILRDSLKTGMTVSGDVTAIRKFGAFVDIGGIEGLIPISEISWGRVEDISSILSIGQEVDVVIKKLDWEDDKYSFSLKEIIPNPWNEIELKYPNGSIQKGNVSRLAPFGAFITLEPGIDGLLHISDLGKGKRLMHSREVLEENQDVEVRITKVDRDRKRISLELISSSEDTKDSEDYRKHLVTGQKESSGSFGTLGDLLREKLKR
ncbi:30S ribosomal protein S1 [Thermodesulfobacteriota bacterium]